MEISEVVFRLGDPIVNDLAFGMINNGSLAAALSVFLGMAGTLASSGANETRDLLNQGNLQGFRPVERWECVGDARPVEGKPELKLSGEGTILVNGAFRDPTIPYLISAEEFGDVRVELEFMIPKNSNSGVYLMGRYEVQILDSFGKQRVGSGDLGAIYQRWDPDRPEGSQGFGGIAPMLNAAKAPGEWQTMEIVFRAPRFSGDGRKLQDATFERVLVNGIIVQEGAGTSGVTRSAPLEGEAAKGPIAIQGDHGPIAIRRFQATPLPDPAAERLSELDAYWAEVSRTVRTGDFEAYKAACHDEAVLVSGTKETSYPLGQALARWKQEFDDTRTGRIKASVDFRFAHRYGDGATAHEAGVFLYIQQPEGGEPKPEYVAFEALLVKRKSGWKILMEYQKSLVTKAEWDALGPES